MMEIFRAHAAVSQDVISDLERNLRFSLKPVDPNPEFIDHLRQRLTTPKTTTLGRRSDPLDLLIFLSGLVLGLSLLIYGVARLVMFLAHLLDGTRRSGG